MKIAMNFDIDVTAKEVIEIIQASNHQGMTVNIGGASLTDIGGKKLKESELSTALSPSLSMSEAASKACLTDDEIKRLLEGADI